MRTIVSLYGAVQAGPRRVFVLDYPISTEVENKIHKTANAKGLIASIRHVTPSTIKQVLGEIRDEAPYVR